jgi:hypothetical protein
MLESSETIGDMLFVINALNVYKATLMTKVAFFIAEKINGRPRK